MTTLYVKVSEGPQMIRYWKTGYEITQVDIWISGYGWWPLDPKDWNAKQPTFVKQDPA